MGVTPKLKQDLKYFGINLPTDARTRAYKEQVRRFRIEERYIQHLRDLVKEAKSKEAKKVKKLQKKVQDTKFQEEVLKEVKKRNEKYKNNSASRIQLNYYKNKLFYMLASDSAWKSYFRYSLWNDRPDVVGIQNLTYDEVAHNLMEDGNYRPTTLTTNDIRIFLSFFNFVKFIKLQIKTTKQFKVNYGLDFQVFDAKNGSIIESFPISVEATTIRNTNDIFTSFEKIYEAFRKPFEKMPEKYLYPFRLVKTNIEISKINPSTGSSYVKLPDYIANKKAVINIKNEDNKCFLYSVLCALNISNIKYNPERVSHYSKLIDTLKWKEKEMPMDINKIMFFEKRNKLRINVYGLENEKNIIPLYVSSNRHHTEYPLIHLFYYEKHYCYVRDFNRLMGCTVDKNMVCPYCCEFKSCGGGAKSAMDRHMSYCISGQKIEMPKEGENILKFTHYSNINECPVRIYADFETFNDTSMKRTSKNGNTSFNTGHKPASFKILVVSDIPIEGYEKVEKFYTYSFMYKGVNSDRVFVEKIQELENEIINCIYDNQYKYKFSEKMIISEEQKQQHNNCKSCWLCKKSFTTENKKVRHHNHNTGHFHSTICNKCNIQIKDKPKIPVFFHKLNYDKNVFFKSLVYYDKIKEVNILPDNLENYKSFSVGRLHFIDSVRFLNSSLAELISNLPENNMPLLKHLANGNDEKLEYIKRKGYFPYEWFDCIDKLKSPITELKREHFNNKLTISKLDDNVKIMNKEDKRIDLYGRLIDDKCMLIENPNEKGCVDEWEYIQKLIVDLNITTVEDFHDFYLDVDVNGLADVFENFRQTSLEYYKLDPCHYVGTPSFAWDSLLLKQNIELELLTDSEMYLFFERGIRGGQSVIFEKHAVANNKYLTKYDETKPSIYIIYLDANNLYGEAMIHKLPFRGFKWVDNITIEDIMNYNEDTNDLGYVLEVDLKYPKRLHDLHNDYPLAPERKKLGNCEKLCGTLTYKENYIVHIKNLKFYLEQGLELTNIKRVIQFEQKAWMKEWIDMNTAFRTNAKNDFEINYFKLMNNSTFGKTMENVRGRVDIKTAFDEEYFKKYASKPNYKRPEKIGDDKYFTLLEMKKNTVKLDKPIYAGFSILDYSKLHMFKFHYEVMKPKFGEKINLLMTDTDSLLYKIEIDDFYQEMVGMKKHFDMSEYDESNPIYDPTNKKVIGCFKDEVSTSVIGEFVGVRPKCYAISTDDNKVVKKLKGISKCVVKKNIQLEDYKNCVLNNKTKIVDVNAIRTSKLTNYSIVQKKKALDNNDDKRVWNGTKSLAYGHYKLKCSPPSKVV